MPLRPRGDLLSDQRGQAIEIAWALLVLAAFGVIYALSNAAWDPMHAELSDVATHQTTTTGLTWTATIFENLPFIAVGISTLGMIALAVYRGRI